MQISPRLFDALGFLLLGVGAGHVNWDGDTTARVKIANRFIRRTIDPSKLEPIIADLADETMAPGVAEMEIGDLLGGQGKLALKNIINRKCGFPNDETCDMLGGPASRLPFIGQGVYGKGWRRFIKRMP